MPNALNLSDYFTDTTVGDAPLRFKASLITGKLSRLVLVGDVLGFIASPDYNGKVQVKVSAIDENYQQTSQNWNITFLPVNDVPRPKVALPYRFPMTEDTVASLDIATLFLDVDAGDVMSFAIGHGGYVAIDLPSGSTVASLVPAQDWFGEEVVIATATDAQGASTDLVVTLAVEGIPDAPRLLRPLGEVDMMQGGVVTVMLDEFFTDPDGGALSYSISADASLRPSVDAATGILALSPAPGWYGIRELFVTAVGSTGLSATCRMLVVVEHVVPAPHIDPSPPGSAVALMEGGSMAFEAHVRADAYLGPLIYEWRLDGRLVGVSWFLWLEAGYDDAGVHALSATVTNEQGASDSHAWTVTVEDVDRAPVGGIVSPTDKSSYPEGTEIPFVALVYDPDGGTVAYQWYVDAAVDGQGPSFGGSLPVGDHNVRLVAGSGGAALEDSVNVTVERAPAGGHWLAVGAVATLALTGAAVAALAALRRRRGRGA